MINNHQAPLITTPNTKYVKSDFTSKSILDKAQGNWPMILESLGVNSSCLKDKHGPCPVCGGKDRFRFDNKEGRGTFICNHCGAGDGVKVLQNLHDWRLQEAIDRIARILGETTKPCHNKPQHVISCVLQVFKENARLEISSIEFDKRRKYLNSVWAQAQPITIGDPVDRYLKARGIKLEAVISVLRFHPSLPYYDDHALIGKFPTMLALVRNHDSQAIALHRTYLGNGCKADVPTPRKIMPSKPNILSGAAIRLFDPIDGKLAIAEGIETALAFHYATQIPVWSAISACCMENVILPANIRELIILNSAVELSQASKSA